jgi:hypothetical protein
MPIIDEDNQIVKDFGTRTQEELDLKLKELKSIVDGYWNDLWAQFTF